MNTGITKLLKNKTKLLSYATFSDCNKKSQDELKRDKDTSYSALGSQLMAALYENGTMMGSTLFRLEDNSYSCLKDGQIWERGGKHKAQCESY
jgi:hypothetical protein